MWHPWRRLRELTHVVVVWARPSTEAPAATNGTDVIWMDRRLMQMERRCALTHELVHLDQGHHGCQPRAIEHAVRAEVARLHIPLEALVHAMPWALSLEDLADELWVTPMVLMDRLGGLTPAERTVLAARAHEDHL